MAKRGRKPKTTTSKDEKTVKEVVIKPSDLVTVEIIKPIKGYAYFEGEQAQFSGDVADFWEKKGFVKRV